MKAEINELAETLTALAKEKYPSVSAKLIELLLKIQSEHFDDQNKASRLMLAAVENELKPEGNHNA